MDTKRLSDGPGESKSLAGFTINRLAQLTYRELDENADCLANYLAGYQIKSDQVVGIFMERSTEMITALFGVLKAGAAYLPLDPNAPDERLAFILNEAAALSPDGLPVVLTQKRLASRLPDIPARVIFVDQESEAISNALPADTLDRPAPGNLAYVTYTSGSTGQSKGVMVEHHSLANAYLAWERDYNLKSATSHLQMANFTFDVFSGDLVRALCSGGKLVLCPRVVVGA